MACRVCRAATLRAISTYTSMSVLSMIHNKINIQVQSKQELIIYLPASLLLPTLLVTSTYTAALLVTGIYMPYIYIYASPQIHTLLDIHSLLEYRQAANEDDQTRTEDKGQTKIVTKRQDKAYQQRNSERNQSYFWPLSLSDN